MEELRRVLDKHGVDHSSAVTETELLCLAEQYLAQPSRMQPSKPQPAAGSASILKPVSTPLFASFGSNAASTSSTASATADGHPVSTPEETLAASEWLTNKSFDTSNRHKTWEKRLIEREKKAGNLPVEVKGSESHSKRRRVEDAATSDSKDAKMPDSKIKQDWKIDSGPDRHNLEFKSMYRGDVAMYRRASDRCLGVYLGKSGSRKKGRKSAESRTPLLLSWTDGRSRRSKLNDEHRKPSGRYFSRSSMKILGPEFKPERFNFPKPVKAQDKQPKRWDTFRDESRPAPLAAPSFMSLYASEIPEQGDQGESHEELTMRKAAEFNKALTSTPGDIDLWRRYIDWQDEALFPPGSKRVELVLNEKKLSIYEKALRANPKSEVLIAEYLDMCRQKLDLSTVEEKWKKTIFSHPASIQLWRALLSFFTSELSQFQVSKAQSQFHKSIETMAAIKAGSFSSHKLSREVAERAMIDFLTLSMNFQRQTGFGEKALACFQAIVEFAVFTPEELLETGRRSQVMTLFEIFWDAEVPRFGDSSATGFSQWYQTRRMGGQIFEQLHYYNGPDDPQEDLSQLEPWYRWIQLETWRDKAHWRAWRPNPEAGITDDDCDDPDRLVVHDDVAGHLVLIESEGLRRELVYRFLEYNEVELRARHSSRHSWTLEQFLGLEECGRLFTPLSKLMSKERSRHLPDPADLEAVGWPHILASGSVGAESGYPFSVEAGRDPRLWGLEDVISKSETPAVQEDGTLRLRRRQRNWIRPAVVRDTSKRQFIIQAFEQAISRFPDDNYLRVSFIDFLAETDPKAARKRCKNMLKQPEHRNNLHLLDRYAECEQSIGGINDALKVYNTAAAMAAGVGSIADRAYLARHYAEICLDHNDVNQAISALVMLVLDQRDISTLGVSDGPVPPTTIAKARRTYDEQKNMVTDLGLHVDYVTCRALFEYSTSGIGAATSVYEETLSTLQIPKDFDSAAMWQYEQLVEDHIHLLHWHSQREAAAPIKLREPLIKALQLFPTNPYLLTALIASEARCRIAGRVRKELDSKIRISEVACFPVIYVFAIYAELSQPYGTSVGRVRTLFSRAAANSVARRCPLLWRMWLEFERAQPVPTAAETARSVLYRAIQNCPGAKCVYLDGAARLPSMLDEMLDIIQEKELHLRAPIEELELQAQEKEKADRERKAAAEDALARADDQQADMDDLVEQAIQEEQALEYEKMKEFLTRQNGPLLKEASTSNPQKVLAYGVNKL